MKALAKTVGRGFLQVKTSTFRAYVMSLGCCGFETETAASAVYDWNRLGVVTVDEPAKADLLVISGWINEKFQKRLLQVYRELLSPKYVIAVGACALSGSPFQNAQEKPIKVSDFLPVHMFVPGCPPSPETLLQALNDLRKNFKPRVTQNKILKEAIKQTTVYT